MLKRDFNKLKVGDRVTVTGTQSGYEFVNELGTIVPNDANYGVNDGDLAIKFENWRKGWGGERRQWAFYASQVKHFTITVIPEEPKVEPKLDPIKPVVKKRPHGAQEYKGNGKHSWEKVTGDTVRLRVPGGWLYGKQAEYSSSLMPQTTFVPVPQAVGYAV